MIKSILFCKSIEWSLGAACHACDNMKLLASQRCLLNLGVNYKYVIGAVIGPFVGTIIVVTLLWYSFFLFYFAWNGKEINKA